MLKSLLPTIQIAIQHILLIIWLSYFISSNIMLENISATGFSIETPDKMYFSLKLKAYEINWDVMNST